MTKLWHQNRNSLISYSSYVWAKTLFPANSGISLVLQLSFLTFFISLQKKLSFYDRKNRIFFIYVSSMCVVFSISTHVGNTYYYRMNMKLSQVFQFQNKKPQTCLTLFFIFMNRVQVRRTSFDKIQTMFLRFLFLSPVGERLGTT